MDTLIYVIIAILILLYIIDKKEPLPPMVDIQPAVKVKKDHELLTNREKRDKIYKNIYKSIKEINPLKTYRSWTYIEIPEGRRNIQLSYNTLNIPVFFKKCIELMKNNIPELIILTPINIKDYLPDFPIEMKYDSEIPLKLRIDLIFAYILNSYGGLCISPGTIVYDVNRPLSMLKKYEIVTFGGNPTILQSDNNLEYPNSYIIGSQANTPFIQEYKRLLSLLIKDTYLYNFKTVDDSDILSYLIRKLEPPQFHFGTEYDGTYNSKLEKIHLSMYMGTHAIDFQNKERLIVISIPYDTLLNTSKFQWFLKLSNEQFNSSNLEIKKLIQAGI